MWTMAMVDTMKAMQDRIERTPRMTHDTATSLICDFQYLQHRWFERIHRSLTVARGQWVENYMRSCIQKTMPMFNLQGGTRMVSKEMEEALAGEESAGGKRNANNTWSESQQESLESSVTATTTISRLIVIVNANFSQVDYRLDYN
jgi:hypothetical protein